MLAFKFLLQENPYEVINQTLSSPNDWQEWINNITLQRKHALQSINYNGSIYNEPDLHWIQSSFIQPQMHGYDQYFYDINTHSYTFDN